MSPLERWRSRLGKAPREVGADLREQLRLPPHPPWMHSIDRLTEMWPEHEALIRHGEVVHGFAYLLNDSIERPGDTAAAALVAYSFDPATDPSLHRWSTTIGALESMFHGNKPTPPASPALRATFDEVFTGLARPKQSRIPAAITGGAVFYHSAVVMFREQVGVMTSRWVTLLARRDAPAFPFVLGGGP